MNKISVKISFFVLGLLSLAAAGCSNDLDTSTGEALPEGKYPLELSSQVLDMSRTRSTIVNTWTGGEVVGVKVNGVVRQYSASNPDGILTAILSNNDPFYWTKSTETKTVSAYYPYGYATASALTVQSDQSGDGYLSSDALFAPPTSIAFTNASKSLTFQHLPVKVVVNLKNGDGVTAAEVQGATVTFVNQSVNASFDGNTGVVTPALTGLSNVLPNILPTPASGFQKSVQSLLVPRQMQGKQFIKVTIGSDYYYYTPTGTTDANLTSGKVHTYEITVKRNGLDVKTTESGNWTNGGNVEIQSINAPAKVGDYYYSDKTYSTTLKPDKTCIGVVFWVDGSGGGKIVSLDESMKYWSHVNRYEASSNSIMESYSDGKGATDFILSSRSDIISQYDSFNWIATKRTTSGDNRWYMPAKNELLDLWNVITTVNNSLANASATTLSSIYWATSEIPNNCAVVADLSYGTSYNAYKFVDRKVRAIAAF